MESLWIKAIDALLQGGPVAILSLIIFFMYRDEKKDQVAKWENMAKEQLNCRIEENKTRSELAKALSDLTVAVRLMRSNYS